MAGGTAVGLGLPLLDAMLDGNGEALAQGGALAKRFGVYFWGMGIRREAWIPSATGTNYQLTRLLQPLARHKSHFSVVTGLNVPSGGVSHAQGPTGILTGTQMVKIGDNAKPQGASVDQIIADTIAKGTFIRSLELEIFGPIDIGRSTGLLDYTSWRGVNSPNPTEWDPRKLWKRLAERPGAKPAGGGAAAPDPKLRLSYLDAVLADARDLAKILGASDRKRLEQHMEHVSALESRLSSSAVTPATGGGGTLPADPAAAITDDMLRRPYQNSLKVHKPMVDLLAYALATDATRVFSYVYTRPNFGAPLREAGVVSDHHNYTHIENDNGTPNTIKCQSWLLDRLADLMDVFKATPDGPGKTLLDNVTMLGTSDLAHGYDHSTHNYPVLIVGHGRGTLRQGQHVRVSGDDLVTRAPLTLMRSLGVGNSFGTGAFATSNPISELLA
jgi:hypothetical protein